MAIGVINNRTYAFIGLERVGDVIVYEVTNPNKPVFVQYINTPEDLISPEGSGLHRGGGQSHRQGAAGHRQRNQQNRGSV